MLTGPDGKKTGLEFLIGIQIDDFGDSSIPNLFVTSSITLVEVQILIGIP